LKQESDTPADRLPKQEINRISIKFLLSIQYKVKKQTIVKTDQNPFKMASTKVKVKKVSIVAASPGKNKK
jgi:hypothetical protein